MAKKILKTSEYGPRLKKLKPEWLVKKNNESFPPSIIGKTKFWWKCKKGHEWQATYHNRAGKQSDCPICSGRFVDKNNNLYKQHPLLCKEIHPTKNINFDPKQIHSGSHKKLWWKCKKGHEWQAKITMRVRGNNCPFCSGNRVSKDNNLKVMFPEVAKEWHPTLNGENKPENYLWGSKYKMWWICQNGHEWQAVIGARTQKRGGNGCPKCTHQTSKNDMRIMAELSYVFTDIISRYRIKNTEIDIYLERLKLGIEHDGSYWHRNKDKIDRRKNSLLEENDINLIRVRHYPLRKIDTDDVIYKVTSSIRKKDMDRLYKSIKRKCMDILSANELKLISKYIINQEFLMEEIYLKYISYSPSPLPEHSANYVASKEVKSQWHPTKNKPLTLKNFSRSSNHKVWWKCKKGHEWMATIGSRMNDHACPYCTNRYVSPDNNLQIMLPMIAKEWHPSKNGKLKPTDFTYRSKTKVWWKCKKGHVWEGTIASRYDKKIIRGCMKCYHENRDKDAKTGRFLKKK